jgi:hypothetical protein
MKKNICFILWIAFLSFLLSDNVCLAQRAATADFQQSSILELKNIGVMVGKGETQERYLAVWKQFVNKSKNMDINSAINIVIDEAKQETSRNVNQRRAKVQKYNEIKRIISQEINTDRAILSRSAGRIQPIQRNVYVIERGNPDKFAVQKGNVITTRGELDNSIKDLENKLDSVGDDAQLANVDMQSALQQQQQTLQMLSTISKLLYDTAMAVIRKIGG